MILKLKFLFIFNKNKNNRNISEHPNYNNVKKKKEPEYTNEQDLDDELANYMKDYPVDMNSEFEQIYDNNPTPTATRIKNFEEELNFKNEENDLDFGIEDADFHF